MQLLRFTSAVLAVSVFALPMSARGQTIGPEAQGLALPPSTPSTPSKVASSGTALDAVALKDGAFFRGTLLEWVPDSHALLLLHDGSTRRFEAAAIAHVDSANDRAAATGPGPTVAPAEHAPPRAETPTESIAPGSIRLTVHTSAGQALYARSAADAESRLVCTGSCATTIPRGDYLLGLSRGGRSPLMSKSWTHVDRNTRLDGTLYRGRAARIVGGVILTVGGATGLVIFGHAKRDQHDRDGCGSHSADGCLPALAGGAFLAALSTLVGVFLVTRRDSIEFQSEPESDTTESLSEPALEPQAAAR